MRHHYIPEFYLRNFCTREHNGKNSIWVFHERRAPFKANIENVAVMKNFYTTDKISDKNGVEKLLSMIESHAAPILQKIISRSFILTKQEKLDFSYFLAFLWLRTPYFRKLFERNAEKIAKESMKIIASNPEKFSVSMREMEAETGEKVGDEEESLRKDFLEDKYNLKFDLILYLQTLFYLGHNPEIWGRIASMWWTFFISSKEHEFITSDNPFVLFNPSIPDNSFYGYGIGQKDIQITVPLSPRICLQLTWCDCGRVVHVTDKTVRAINCRTAAWVAEHIYSSSKAKFILDVIGRRFKI